MIGSAAGEPREVEAAPAVSVTLGCLPGTELRAVRVDDGNLPDGGEPRFYLGFSDVLGCLRGTELWAVRMHDGNLPDGGDPRFD